MCNIKIIGFIRLIAGKINGFVGGDGDSLLRQGYEVRWVQFEVFSLKFEVVQSATSSDLMVTLGCIEKGTTLEILITKIHLSILAQTHKPARSNPTTRVEEAWAKFSV